MSKLIVGFDSAWTVARSGALVGALVKSNGKLEEIGVPRTANFAEAERIVEAWQSENKPSKTIIFLDQPTVVKNVRGQRPVENIVSSIVGRRGGGIQPANTGRAGMFNAGAPLWPFLNRFGGPADPLAYVRCCSVFETYPVLTILAMGWAMPAGNGASRLPKYNPERRKTFLRADWEHICRKVSMEFKQRRLNETADWVGQAATRVPVRKPDQDRLDACLCLLAALNFIEGKNNIMVGDLSSGYIVVPDNSALRRELKVRCGETNRTPGEWVRLIVANLAT